MLVAALAAGVGLVCLYYGARALRVGRALRRRRGRRGPERPPARPGPGDRDVAEPGETIAERGSLERGVVLLALGAVCLLFGVLAA